MLWNGKSERVKTVCMTWKMRKSSAYHSPKYLYDYVKSTRCEEYSGKQSRRCLDRPRARVDYGETLCVV